MKIDRRTRFNVLMSQLERARLDALCEHYGIDGSTMIRHLLRAETERLKLEVRALPKKRGR